LIQIFTLNAMHFSHFSCKGLNVNFRFPCIFNSFLLFLIWNFISLLLWIFTSRFFGVIEFVKNTYS
jgi:hypothetical protein